MHIDKRVSLALALGTLLTCSGCFGRGELLQPQTLQPTEVTEFLGAVPPPAFRFLDWNEWGYPEYLFEIDGSTMIGIPGSDGTAPFLIARHEITNSQFRRFCDETGRIHPRNPANPAWRHYYYLAKPQHPIDHVAWFDANDYAIYMGLDLPSAREWTHAATLGGKPAWMDGPRGLAIANIHDVGHRAPDRIGSYPADTSPAGAQDMAGNVDEWVADAGYGPNRRVMGGDWSTPRDGLPALVETGASDDAHNARHGFRTMFRLRPLE